jgi:hypothetical protein
MGASKAILVDAAKASLGDDDPLGPRAGQAAPSMDVSLSAEDSINQVLEGALEDPSTQVLHRIEHSLKLILAKVRSRNCCCTGAHNLLASSLQSQGSFVWCNGTGRLCCICKGMVHMPIGVTCGENLRLIHGLACQACSICMQVELLDLQQQSTAELVRAMQTAQGGVPRVEDNCLDPHNSPSKQDSPPKPDAPSKKWLDVSKRIEKLNAFKLRGHGS